MHWFISVRTTGEWLTGNAKKKEDTCWTWYETQTNKLCDNLFKPYHPPVPLKLPRKTLITLTPTPIPYDNKEKEREREKKIKTSGRWGDRWRDRWRRDRQKKRNLHFDVPSKEGEWKAAKRRKDWRGWDLLIKWLEVRLCEMQTVADVILISDFLFTLTHQHLSIYHSSDSIFLSQSFAD